MARLHPSPQQLKILAHAVELHKSGKLDKAEILYCQFLSLFPAHAETLNFFGMLRFQQGNIEEAELLLLKSTSLNRNSPHFLINLGELYRSTGRAEKALKAFRKALQLDTRSIEARFCLANTLHDQGHIPEAITSYQNVISKRYFFPEAHNALGTAFQESGRIEDAIREFELAIEQRPNYAEAWLNLGNTFISNNEISEQIRQEQAAKCYLKAIHFNPNLAEAHFKVGEILLGQEYTEEAARHFSISTHLRKNWADAWLKKGMALEYLGKADEAFEAYFQASQIDNSLVEAYYGQARNKKHLELNENVWREAEALLKNQQLTDQEAGRLHFALGKVFDDAKMFDQAFVHYVNANCIRAKSAIYSAENHSKLIDRYISTYQPEYFLRHPHSSTTPSPIFIVGLPRSGTTLTEQILASHPEVFGAGELLFFHELTTNFSLRFGDDYPNELASLSETELHQSANDYLNHLQSRARKDYTYIVDKMHLNFMYLGLIATLFPNAPLIFCTRNSLDNGLALYFQDFSNDFAYAFDLKSIGAYICEHNRLMAHWRRVLPNPIIEIQYEKLVEAPEIWTRKLISHIGLQWNDACLRPHQQERTVKTASHWQVRQPIYTTSVERWKHYEKHLSLLKQALGYQ